MDDLIARLEKATGPDQNLDCWIAAALGILDDFDPSIFIALPTYRVSDDGRRVEAWTQVGSDKPWRQASRAPSPYTASIDAALTLVPNDLNWSINNRSEARVGGPVAGFTIKGGSHVVPAIALCIAALKARQSVTPEKRSPKA